MPGAVTVVKETATGEQRDAIGTNIGNKVQDTGQELRPHDQIRAKEMTTAEWKTTITRVTGQKDHLAKNCRNCFIR